MSENIFREKKIQNLHDAANASLLVAIFVGVWELVFVLGIFPKIALPSPMMVADSFAKIIANMSLPFGIAVTMGRLVAGFSISIILGTLIGLAMVKFKGFGRTLNSFSAGLLAFPSIAWVPF